DLSTLPDLSASDARSGTVGVAAVSVLQRPLPAHRPGTLARRKVHVSPRRGGGRGSFFRGRHPRFPPSSRPSWRPFVIEKRRSEGSASLFFPSHRVGSG